MTADGDERVARSAVAALQRTLLPAELPVLPGVTIAARHVADGAAPRGGDWFDAVPRSDGTVALVVGGVVGQGLTAVAAMGQLRAVFRRELAVEADLGAALAGVDRFAAREPPLRAATVCVAVLEPAGGTVRYCTCGHPPPLVVAGTGRTRFLAPTGAGPLGVAAASAARSGAPAGPAPASVQLATGETVVLYTSGLVLRAGCTLDEGMADLAAAAGGAAGGAEPGTWTAPRPAAVAGAVDPTGSARVDEPPPPPTAPEPLCRRMVARWTGNGQGDDVAVLAAQRLPAPAPALDLRYTASVSAVPEVRRDLDEWLDRLGVAAGDRLALALAVAEAVANAVEHAYPPGRPGPVRLQAALRPDGRIECRVSDRGRWRPPGPAAPGRGFGLVVAEAMVDEMRVVHVPPEPASTAGRGTLVVLGHRPQRPVVFDVDDGARSPAGRSADRTGDRVPFSADIQRPGTGSVPRVRVRGRVDVTTAEPFVDRLFTGCRGGVLSLTVDLSEVTFLGSAGVRALYRVREQLAVHGQRLTTVAVAGSPARGVLELVGLSPAPPETGDARERT